MEPLLVWLVIFFFLSIFDVVAFNHVGSVPVAASLRAKVSLIAAKTAKHLPSQSNDEQLMIPHL